MTPLQHFLLILFAWLISQAFARRQSVHVLTVVGMAASFTYAPVAMLVILLTAIEAMVLVFFLSKLPRASTWRKYGAYILLFNLLFVDFHSLIFNMPLAILGISFSVIRVFMTTKQLISARKKLIYKDLYWIAVSGFYLPALVIGPVFSGTELRDQYNSNADCCVSLRDYRMILQGLVLSVFATALLSEIASLLESTFFLFAAPILFLQLFAAFWGQSLVAEHTSRLFGYRLPVNFDRPWKARNVHEFWGRWHRSMAQFVLQYIFLPLNLRGLSPKIATVSAFIFMGLWHNLTLGYFVWGLAHGIMLAFFPKSVPAGFSSQMLSRIFLWTMVVGLSYFANYGPYS
jgi:D-alanyl-lipoteichoic acid acyltransferase DltB (MBOAT superfamily)